MIRDRNFYLDMLDRNPNATIGFSLAAKMVVAAHVADSDVWDVARRLKQTYGEVMTQEEVRREMGEPQ